MNSDKDIKRLGELLLFWGVTGGNIDFLVANYTATKKWRKKDNYTPGGINNKPPERALTYINWEYCPKGIFIQNNSAL